MTARPDDHIRPLLGAFVLDHLAPDEATAVRAHLDGCTSCRAEETALRAVGDLLPLADLERVSGPPELPPPDLLDEVISRIEHHAASERRERRRSIGLQSAIAAALAIAALLTAVTVSTEPSSGGEIVAMEASLPGVQGEAVVHADPDATWVELTTSGLAPGETYSVWLEESGTQERSPLGTFTAVSGDLYISLYSTLPRDRAGSIGVSAPDGSTVMVAVLPTVLA